MHLHSITFRIHDDYSYQNRWSSVVDAIKAATQTTYWDEPTSFFLIKSTKNSAGVADMIEANSTFADDRDLLLVTNLSEKGYTERGVIHDSDLKLLMSQR